MTGRTLVFTGGLTRVGVIYVKSRGRRWGRGHRAVTRVADPAVFGLGMIAGAIAFASGIQSLGWGAALSACLAVMLATLAAMLLAIPELRLDLRAAVAATLSPMEKVAT